MSKIKVLSHVIIVLVVVSAALGSASAQGGGGRGMPSQGGGRTGGPGMSGAATMPIPQVPQPTAPTGNLGSNAGGNIGQGNAGGNVGQGRERPSFTMSGQTGEGGLQGRFGERGSGNLTIGRFQPGEGQSWFQLGGFGASSEGEGRIPQDMGSTPWRPAELPTDVPAAPAAFDSITGVTQAQGQAQDAVQTAGQQISTEAQAAMQNAQAAYDQFWTDYYAAIDYTAQVYYSTATATADYLLQSYTQAVNYTMQAVDYYLAYYDQYAAYCYYYPWDCAMYAYDIATGTYYYVGDVSAAPVTTVEIGDVTVNTGYPPAKTPTPSAEAYEAIVLFANDQLGAVVEPLYAGDVTAEVEVLLQQLPPEMQAFLLRTTNQSCADYWGLLSGGVAAVTVGNCTTGTAIMGDDLAVQLSAASAGAYAIRANAAMPTMPSEALQLITTVYPGLEGLAFAQISDIEGGMAFTATSAGLGTDPMTGESLSVPKVVYAGVVDVEGKPLVYALVGVGQSYVALIASGEVLGS